jgi:hypothetical protein
MSAEVAYVADDLQSTQAPHSNHFFDAHPDKTCQLADDERQATAARRYNAMM